MQTAAPSGADLTSRKPIGQTLLSGSQGALGGDSIETQVARLSDTRLPIRQRLALAAEIGRVHGNQQLQRVMARLRENDGAQKYTLNPFSPFPPQAAPTVQTLDGQYEAHNDDFVRSFGCGDDASEVTPVSHGTVSPCIIQHNPPPGDRSSPSENREYIPEMSPVGWAWPHKRQFKSKPK